MDNMNSDNDLNASTSCTGAKESVINSLQDVKNAIEANRKYPFRHTHQNMEVAINKFDLQRSNDLVKDWIHDAETSDRLLDPLEPPPKVLKDIGKGVVNRLIKHIH